MTPTPYRTLLALFLAALLGVPAGLPTAARAAEDEEKEESAESEGAGEDTTELAKQMEVIEEAMKKLRRTLKQADQNAQSLEIVTQMQQAAVASKAQPPAMAADMPEAERAKFVQDYRKDMAKFIVVMCDMEVALLDGDNKKAEEHYKALSKWEDDGHEKYTAE